MLDQLNDPAYRKIVQAKIMLYFATDLTTREAGYGLAHLVLVDSSNQKDVKTTSVLVVQDKLVYDWAWAKRTDVADIAETLARIMIDSGRARSAS